MTERRIVFMVMNFFVFSYLLFVVFCHDFFLLREKNRAKTVLFSFSPGLKPRVIDIQPLRGFSFSVFHGF